jgi:hypothetical protein
MSPRRQCIDRTVCVCLDKRCNEVARQRLEDHSDLRRYVDVGGEIGPTVIEYQDIHAQRFRTTAVLRAERRGDIDMATRRGIIKVAAVRVEQIAFERLD